MRYEKIKNKGDREFKRLTGVHTKTFLKMVEIVNGHISEHKKTGRKNKLSIEDQILLTLAYYREYRTYFHLGNDYGLNESNVCRTIKKIETILIKSGLFSLPGKKELCKDISSLSENIIIRDVTETEIERPQRKQKKIIVAKRKNIQLKSNLLLI